jgi:hypothetical protein
MPLGVTPRMKMCTFGTKGPQVESGLNSSSTWSWEKLARVEAPGLQRRSQIFANH